MTKDEFQKVVATITADISGKPLDSSLEQELNTKFPHRGEVVQSLFQACQQGAQEGWICDREAGGVKFSRPCKPSPATHGFSVDVVDMKNTAGPHHVHPNGEIDLIMPLEGEAKFDGHPAGWAVYGPGSQHRPTLSDGRAYVLYLLPDGAIDFNAGAAKK